MEFGDILNNGAKVISTRVANDGMSPIVLAYWQNNPQPYIVWTYNRTECFWGHYFEKLSDAALYFENK